MIASAALFSPSVCCADCLPRCGSLERLFGLYPPHLSAAQTVFRDVVLWIACSAFDPPHLSAAQTVFRDVVFWIAFTALIPPICLLRRLSSPIS